MTAIKYMEEDMARLEQAIEQLERQKRALAEKKPRDMKALCRKVRHMVEHMEQMLSKQMKPTKKAKLFRLLFDKPPTYAELKGGTAEKPAFTGVSALFLPKFEDLYQLGGHLGLEPRTHGLRVRCSNQLS